MGLMPLLIIAVPIGGRESDFAEEAENFLKDVLIGEAELLIKDFVGSGCAEVIEAEDFGFGSADALKGGGESCCEAEYGYAVGNY